MSKSAGSERPFIIWTMQRTGGTNLTKVLMSMSRHKAVHEPFNRPRVYGKITTDWVNNQDKEVIAAAMDETLAKRENIKHCVEMVPWRVSAALVDAASKTDHNHLFLVRESSVDRLLSMEYAQRTKVWGPGREIPDPETDPAFDAPLDVEDLVKHEEGGIKRLNEFWQRLKRAGRKPAWISFEQVYETPSKEAEAHVMRAAKHLGFDNSPEAIADLVVSLRTGGNQQTRDRYARFSGIDDLKAALRNCSPLAFT